MAQAYIYMEYMECPVCRVGRYGRCYQCRALEGPVAPSDSAALMARAD